MSAMSPLEASREGQTQPRFQELSADEKGLFAVGEYLFSLVHRVFPEGTKVIVREGGTYVAEVPYDEDFDPAGTPGLQSFWPADDVLDELVERGVAEDFTAEQRQMIEHGLASAAVRAEMQDANDGQGLPPDRIYHG